MQGVGGQEVIPALAPAVVAAAVQHALLEDADGSSQPAGRHQCSILVTLQHAELP